jgi:diketogulonate reductase-like aldo/keto reductase
MKRRFGSAQVPVIGQGTWNLENDDRAEAIRALRRGFDLGLTHVDTAEMYGSGRVEEIVGEAIAGRRDELFVVSKVLPRNATRAGVVRACERSLAQLKTDRLDVYLLHWPSEHPLEETVAGFEELARAGKVRAWGVSNFDVDQLERVVAIAGPGRVACNQVLYHLGARYPEGALLKSCARHSVALVGYSPFGSGRFPSERSAGGRALAEVARARGATVRQVALAFLTRLDDTFTIPKAARPEHVEDNAAAAKIALEPSDVARLDAAFPVSGESL